MVLRPVEGAFPDRRPQNGAASVVLLKDAVIQMFGLQAVFGPGTGEVKKAAIMDFLKNAIGVGELALGGDLVDEAEFVAGLDQAAEGGHRALKATNLWRKAFGSVPASISSK